METATFTGRVRKPLWKKLTGWCWWWWMNDDDPHPPIWYHNEWSAIRRWVTWHIIRNPLHNLAHYVVGVKDRNFKVIGTGSTTDKVDIGEEGWCWCVIQSGDEILIKRPYASYGNYVWSWHLGWMWDGAFGIRFLVHDWMIFCASLAVISVASLIIFGAIVIASDLMNIFALVVR